MPSQTWQAMKLPLDWAHVASSLTGSWLRSTSSIFSRDTSAAKLRGATDSADSAWYGSQPARPNSVRQERSRSRRRERLEQEAAGNFPSPAVCRARIGLCVVWIGIDRTDGHAYAETFSC